MARTCWPVGPVKPRPLTQARQIRLAAPVGARKLGPGRQIDSQDNPKRRQPTRRSGRDPASRPYAPITSRSGKPRRKHYPHSPCRLRCAWIVYRRLLWQHADLPVMSVRDQSCGRLGLLLMAWARDRDRPGGCNRMRLDARLRDGLPVRASAREPAAGSDQLAALGGRMSSSAAPSRSLSISRGVRVSCVPYGISARDAGVEPGAEQLKRAPDRILCAPHPGCRRLAVPA
jgi:hypothetical protein